MKVLVILAICLAGILAQPSSYTLNFERGNNPYNIKFDTTRSNNYFIVMGDWGQHDGGNRDCQNKIGADMRAYVDSQTAAGKTLLFIAAVGDNFYWTGMTDECENKEGNWVTQWSDVYGSLSTDYYWFPCMGNHDYGPHDPYAMCPWQISLDRAGNQLPNCAPEKYKLQEYGYYYRFDELSFEFLSLDTSVVDCPGGIGGDGQSSYFTQCGGTGPACAQLQNYYDASEALLKERSVNSTAESIFAIQHYDNVCQNFVLPTLGTPPNARDIKCAHGHTHQQECMVGSDPDCTVMMTGAAGGCCGESNPYGFAAVALTDDGRMETTTNVAPRYGCGWSTEF